MELSKGLPIQIHLETVVKQENQQQDFIFDLVGQMVKIGDTLYIRYKEEVETQEDPELDTESTTESIPVTIKVLPDGSIQLIRAGEMRLRLKFEYKEMIESSYKTPYGMMLFSTYTHDMHVSLTDQPTAGAVDLVYDLYLADKKVGEYQMKMSFTA